MRAVGILLCAGSASRMGFDKLTEPLAGQTAIERSARALVAGGADALVLAVNERTRAYAAALDWQVPCLIVEGGDTRAESVRRALAASEGGVVLIHDAARCLVWPDLVRRCLESALRYGSGVAAVRATDTAILETEEGGIAALPRERLWLTQTPQAFLLPEIRAAYERQDLAATDDATIYAASGYTPRFVESTADNFKLTRMEDWRRAQRLLTRYGTGFDTHRLVAGRPLILGGIRLPFDRGLLGHSDADVVAHAVMDALLGAAALGDIGRHFPDTEKAYAGADSIMLLRRVVALLAEKGFRPAAVDVTVIAEAPKIAPHAAEMRHNLSKALGIPPDCVSIKATTSEGMNDEGKGLCISAQAVASVC